MSVQLVQEKTMFNWRSSSVSAILNNSLLWKFLVYRIADLNLGIYFCIFIDSKKITKPCSFLNKQEYFLPKKKHILPSIFVNCALYLRVSSRFPRSCSTRFTADVENANESLHNVRNPFSPTLKTVLFLQRKKLWIEIRLLSQWTEG